MCSACKTAITKVTHVPDTEDDPWGKTRFPLGVLFNHGFHQREKLGRVVLDLAVDLNLSLIITIYGPMSLR